ncbi:MAG: TonB-dependent receptor [Sphingobacteriaceae bacterium]|nr:MAG: TonB-dependent receptor [Sphingobacteriaceae bacterium]
MKKVLLLKQEGNARLKWKCKHLLKKRGLKEALAFASVVFFLLISASSFAQTKPVTGIVADTTGEALIGVSVKEKGTNTGVGTDARGRFSLNVSNANGTLVVSYIGYATQEVAISGKTDLRIRLKSSNAALTEVLVTGYTTQKKESLTAAISSITSKDLDRVHAGTNASQQLAGKIPGVSFKAPEGRPGASASINIRNFGPALFVIDGIQQDEGQFNNISPNDIESITVLKDASAAIYGVRSANGVVVVTTKRGKFGAPNTLNLEVNRRWENLTRFPTSVNNSYDYMRYRAEAEVNLNNTTNITPAELEKYRQGTAYGYQSFNWRDFIYKGGAPLTNLNVSATGGSDKITYYLSASHVDQESILGQNREFKFYRTNFQSNVTAKITDRITAEVQVGGRIETRENPGVPGGDDYANAKFALFRNTPLERPFANDNPAYINDIKHNETNFGYLTRANAGYLRSDWRVLQTNFKLNYTIPGIKGLTARGTYSYYIADFLQNIQEYTYKAYTYNPTNDVYTATGGSTNPYRQRDQNKVINTTLQGQLDYNNTFGKHSISAFLVAERLENRNLNTYVHSVPTTNVLPLIYFATVDTYDDGQRQINRAGYAARLSYNYASRYFVEASARRDASSIFAPDRRVGYFPSGSVGWRITEEPFMKSLLGNSTVLSDLKFRASYGLMGDDRNPNDSNQPIVGLGAYLPGYNYNAGTNILSGNAVVGSQDRGAIQTNISWLKIKNFDVGTDYSLFGGKVTGAIDYFMRKRSGLLASRYDVLVPSELGYALPQENLNSDATYGGEFSIAYNNKVNDFNYSIGGNIGLARTKNDYIYKEIFNNSLDRYFNGRTDRYTQRYMGYEVLGQFQSQEEINNYPVNIDRQGNKTLLPGDLIIKDNNGDGYINDLDRRAIGYGNGSLPMVNFGFQLGLNYKGFNLNADFSGATGYTWLQNWETRSAFQNTGAFNTILEDRWHRADIYDVNSAWIPGKNPPIRYNRVDLSSFNNGSTGTGNNTFFTHNVTYFRIRTLELGYALPKSFLTKVNIKGARVYVNSYNLFSIDNLKKYGVDPETNDDNGLQYAQTKNFNIGIKLAL